MAALNPNEISAESPAKRPHRDLAVPERGRKLAAGASGIGKYGGKNGELGSRKPVFVRNSLKVQKFSLRQFLIMLKCGYVSKVNTIHS